MENDDVELKRRLKRREDMFLRRLFGMLAKMAKADGKVDAWEAHAAEKAFVRFPRAAARRRFCIRVFNEAKDSRISLARMAWDFANKWACAEDCLAAYEILWDIACATSVLKPVHKANLASLCRYLNLPESYFGIYCRKRQGTFREWTAQDEARVQEEERKKAEARRKIAEDWCREESRRQSEREARERARQQDYQSRMWNWFRRHFNDAPYDRTCAPPRRVSPLKAEYDLIGCSPDASNEDVRIAYHSAAKKCHPDLLRAQGQTEVQMAMATAKMARINEAWEKVRKERGI